MQFAKIVGKIVLIKRLTNGNLFLLNFSHLTQTTGGVDSNELLTH